MTPETSDPSIEALLIDFDGVVLDTEETRLKAWKRGLARSGTVLDVETYIRLNHTPPGCTPSQLARTLTHGGLGAEAIDTLLRSINADNLRLATSREEMPGVRTLLSAARHADMRTALISGSSRRWITLHLQRLRLADEFDVVVTRDDTASGKPDPAPYLLALDRLAVAPNGAVAIEDSPIGLAAACDAGVACAVVPNRVTAGLAFDRACARYATLSDVTVPALTEAAQRSHRATVQRPS